MDLRRHQASALRAFSPTSYHVCGSLVSQTPAPVPSSADARPEPRWRHQAPLWAALLAAAASLPGLRLPFLSDDWALIETVTRGLAHATPYGDFRPLFMASLWLDHTLFGLQPFFFHLTNTLLLALTAALVVVLTRRYTNDPRLAALTGFLYALHPYHVENSAWISARTEPLYGVFFLTALLTHERWLKRPHGLPLLTMTLFQAALFSKETALTLPAFLTLLACFRGGRSFRQGLWLRGYTVLWIQLALHFILRFWILDGSGRTLTHGSLISWVLNGLAYGAAALLPAPTELLLAHPALWGAIALAVLMALFLTAAAGRLRLPPTAFAGGVAFAVLLGPSVVGLQERYLLLPSAASALVLASLLLHFRRPLRWALLTPLLILWLFFLQAHWHNWQQAAQASERLVAELTHLSRQKKAQEIVVANMPFQVSGGSVAGDMRAALALSSGLDVDVHAACYISYSAADADIQEQNPDNVQKINASGQVRIRVPREPYSRFVGPHPQGTQRLLDTPMALLQFRDDETIDIHVKPGATGQRLATMWGGGRLKTLH